MWEKGEITKIHSGAPPSNLPKHPARPSHVSLVEPSKVCFILHTHTHTYIYIYTYIYICLWLSHPRSVSYWKRLNYIERETILYIERGSILSMYCIEMCLWLSLPRSVSYCIHTHTHIYIYTYICI
jgi:hypothetical protein